MLNKWFLNCKHRQAWLMLLIENLTSIERLIHWAILTRKNNHCSNNCLLVMTKQRIVTVISVILHASPQLPFFLKA